MKILLVNDYGTPTGGAELVVSTLRDALRQRGHDVRLFASTARPGPGENVADYVCLGTTSRFRTLLQSANPWAYLAMRRILREFAPDVVHVNVFLTQLSPLILPLLRRVPSLYYVHWNRPVCPTGTKTLPDGTPCRVPAGCVCRTNRCLPLHDWVPLMIQTWLWRRWRHAFDLVVANSEGVQRLLAAEGFSPLVVVRCGVPEQRSRPPIESPPTACFVGRLVRQKGVDVLLKAFSLVTKQVAGARLVIVGDGPERISLQTLIAELGLASHVSLVGQLPRDQVATACSRAWVQVIPSRFAEAYPLVAGEAMMRATAVVASDCGGISETVQHGRTGLLVPPGDVRALADALVELLGSAERADSMGRTGRAIAIQQWSKELFVDRLCALYESVVRKEVPPTS